MRLVGLSHLEYSRLREKCQKGKISEFDHALTSRCKKILEYVEKKLGRGELELAGQIAEGVYQLSRTWNNEEYPLIQIQALNKISICKRHFFAYEIAIENLLEAIDLAIKYNVDQVESLVNMSAVQMDMKQYNESKMYSLRAIKFICANSLKNDHKTDVKLAAIAYYNCGKSNEYLDDPHEAVSSYKHALSLLKKSGVGPDEDIYKKISLAYLKAIKAFRKDDTKESETKMRDSIIPKSDFHKNPTTKPSVDQGPRQPSLHTRNSKYNFQTSKSNIKLVRTTAKPSKHLSSSQKKSNAACGMGSSSKRMDNTSGFRINKTPQASTQNHSRRSSYKLTSNKHITIKERLPPRHSYDHEESWDENPKGIITIKSSNSVSSKKMMISTEDDVLERNKRRLVLDLKSMSKNISQHVIIQRGKPHLKHKDRDLKDSSNSSMTDEAEIIQRNQEISKSFKLTQAIDTEDRSGIPIKESPVVKITKLNIKQKERPYSAKKSPKKPAPLEQFVFKKQNKPSKMAMESKYKINKVTEPDKSKPVDSTNNEARAEAAARIVKAWKSRIMCDSRLKQQTYNIYRGSKYLSNSYVRIQKESPSRSTNPQSIPFKIMIYLFKGTYLLAMINLTTMELSYMSVPTTVNIMAGDFKRLRIRASPKNKPFLMDDNLKKAVNQDSQRSKASLEGVKPIVASFRDCQGTDNPPHSSRQDSLERLKQDILNGKLEDEEYGDNEDSLSRDAQDNQNESLNNIKLRPTTSEPLYSNNTGRTGLSVKVNKRKLSDSSSSSVKIEYGDVDIDKKMVAYHLDLIAKLFLMKFGAEVESLNHGDISKQKGHYSKRYGNLQNMTQEERGIAMEASALLVQDFMRARRKIKQIHEQHILVASSKTVLDGKLYMIEVYEGITSQQLTVHAYGLQVISKIIPLQLGEKATKKYCDSPEDLIDLVTIENNEVVFCDDSDDEDLEPMLISNYNEANDVGNTKDDDDLEPMLSDDNHRQHGSMIEQPEQENSSSASRNKASLITERLNYLDQLPLDQSDSIHIRKIVERSDEESPVSINKTHNFNSKALMIQDKTVEILDAGEASSHDSKEKSSSGVVEKVFPQEGTELYRFHFRATGGRACLVIAKQISDGKQIVEYYHGQSEAILGFDDTNGLTKDWVIRKLQWPESSVHPVLVVISKDVKEMRKPQKWVVASELGIC